MDDLDFTEEEIREQLEKLGYYDVPTSRLAEYKRDLENLVTHERSKNDSWTTCSDTTPPADLRHTRPNPYNAVKDCPQCTEYSSSAQPRYGKENILHGHTVKHPVVSKERVGTIHNASTYTTDSDTPDVRQAHNDTLDTTTERKMMKRRVLRRRDGRAEISDELTESEGDDLSYLGDRMDEMRLSPELFKRSRSFHLANHPNHFDPYQHISRAKSKTENKGNNRFGLPGNYDGPTSVIVGMPEDPHTSCLIKSDPVASFQKYQRSWAAQHAPGEKSHKALRWNVRAQMLFHDDVVQKKTNKVYVPNSYVIPSDKKRKSLRWQVRQDMAQGIMPPSNAYDVPY